MTVRPGRFCPKQVAWNCCEPTGTGMSMWCCAGYAPEMAAVIKTVTFDAADALALALATFWAAVFGSDVDDLPTTSKALVESRRVGRPDIWFTPVAEPKTAKNRVHFDLRAPGPVHTEAARLHELSATIVAPTATTSSWPIPKATGSAWNPGRHTIDRNEPQPPCGYDSAALSGQKRTCAHSVNAMDPEHPRCPVATTCLPMTATNVIMKYAA